MRQPTNVLQSPDASAVACAVVCGRTFVCLFVHPCTQPTCHSFTCAAVCFLVRVRVFSQRDSTSRRHRDHAPGDSAGLHGAYVYKQATTDMRLQLTRRAEPSRMQPRCAELHCAALRWFAGTNQLPCQWNCSRRYRPSIRPSVRPRMCERSEGMHCGTAPHPTRACVRAWYRLVDGSE